MPKSPDAFRTISEVADWLGIQAHVLRFWESKFTQVKPIKRAGGRRYYRPADMQLLGGIKKLLHEDGLTIKGVQKLLREEGMNHVSAMSMPLEDAGEEGFVAPVAEQTTVPPKAEPDAVVLPFEAPKESVPVTPEMPENTPTLSGTQEITTAVAETEAGSGDAAVAPPSVSNPGQDLPQTVSEQHSTPSHIEPEPKTEVTAQPTEETQPIETAVDAEIQKPEPAASAIEPHSDSMETSSLEAKSTQEQSLPASSEDVKPEEEMRTAPVEPAPHTEPQPANIQTATEESEPVSPEEQDTKQESETSSTAVADAPQPIESEAKSEELTPVAMAEQDTIVSAEKSTVEPKIEEVDVTALPPEVVASPVPEAPDEKPASAAPLDIPLEDAPETSPQSEDVAPLFSFLRTTSEAEVAEVAAPAQVKTSDEQKEIDVATALEEPASPPPAKPRDIGMPELTPENEFAAKAAILSQSYSIRSIDSATALKAAPLLEQLTAVRDRMSARRGSNHPKS